MKRAIVVTVSCAIAVLLVTSLGAPRAVASSAGGSAPPNWTGDIGPLMAEKCMTCHRPGEVAPMSLLTYEQVLPWAKSIRMVVRERVMPPWHADQPLGHFANDRRLNDEQIGMIVDWVNAGAPMGAGEFTAPEFVEGWALTEVLGTPPDYVFEFDEDFIVDGGGPDVYIDVKVPMNLEEDIWVQGAEVRGNPAIVHHATVTTIGPDEEPGGELGTAVPGLRWRYYPEGSAKLVPAGSTVNFNMHYHPIDRQETDRSRMGLWLTKSPVRYVLKTRAAGTQSLEIPAHEPNYEAIGEFVLDSDALLFGFGPHMHLRGKDMTCKAIYPDGREEILLSVPRYDFNWQTTYEVEQPIAAPKGTVIRAVAHWDNSENNPNNPNPDVKVLYGRDSRDEMMSCFIDYMITLDEPVIPTSIEATGSKNE